MTSPSTTAPGRRPSRSPNSGATIVDQPAELCDRDIVFTILAGSADFQQVVAGPKGLLSGSGPRAGGHRRLDHDLGGGVGGGASRGREARDRAAGGAGQRQPEGREGGAPDDGHLRTRGGAPRRAALPRDHRRRRRHVLRRRRPRPAGQGVPQPDARDRRADARGDPRARREGRRLAGRPDGVPEQQRARLDLHPLQDAGLRQPRLHADVHARAAAQGLRARTTRPPASSACRCRWRRPRSRSSRR